MCQKNKYDNNKHVAVKISSNIYCQEIAERLS